jgi:hypothetical protein
VGTAERDGFARASDAQLENRLFAAPKYLDRSAIIEAIIEVDRLSFALLVGASIESTSASDGDRPLKSASTAANRGILPSSAITTCLHQNPSDVHFCLGLISGVGGRILFDLIGGV